MLNVAGASNVVELTKILQKGLPVEALTQFEKSSGLPMEAICEVVQLPQRTLARRKATGKLKGDESERLYRLSALVESAGRCFDGDAAAARTWLTTSKKALAGETPLELAKSEVGAREVEDLLGRLEHGVFS